MYNFSLTKYYNAKSIIHDINPFYKIICTLIFTILLLFTKNTLLLLLIFLFVILLMNLSNVEGYMYIKSIKYSLPLLIFIFIIDLIFKTNVLVTINSILKLLMFILYAQILVFTTRPLSILYGLEKLFSPLKMFNLPVNQIALTISLAIRFIPIIFEEGMKVLKSQLSRGLDFSGSIKEKCNKIISILIPIFMLSFKRSDDIANALDLKLYSEKRTTYKEYDFNYNTGLIVCMHLFLVVICLVVEVFL